jgi:TetR/AcrR family transcriptional regulator
MVSRGRPKAHEQARLARSELYKKLIVDAAEEEFAELGFEAARIQKVAERAQLSVGTIYGLFTSKHELYGAVHLARGAMLIERVSRMVDSIDDAVRAIEQGIAVYVHFYVEHPTYLRMQLREGTIWAMPSGFGTALDENFRRGLEMVSALCARGIAQGAFEEDDPERMAKTITAIHQVQLAHWVESGFHEAPEALIERLRALFRRLYCK